MAANHARGLAAPAALLYALALACAGQQPSRPSLPFDTDAWYEPVEPFRILGPLHYVGTRELGVYLIATPEGHVLLDGATTESAPLIEASIRKLGFEPGEIRHLLITQAHFDHVGTLAHFKRLTGAAVAVMAPDAPLLASGGKTDYLFAEDPAFHFPPVTVDRLLNDGDTVEIGGVSLTARLTPGHTPGTTTWLAAVEEGGRTYSVVFQGSTSVNPGTRFVTRASYRGIAGDYRRAFRLLEALQPDVPLAAHATAFDLEAKRARAKAAGVEAFVDPDGYRRRLAESKARFESLVAQEGPAATVPDGLAGTSWRLVRFEGGDGTVLTPDDPAKYTLSFGADGSLAARIDCNRGRGTWKSEWPNHVELGPLALTRAMCPHGSLHDRIVKHWEYFRSYVIEGGHLFLSLMADGGIYELEPLPAGDSAPPGS